METSRQREILSPRAISQGWVVELDKKVVSLRDQITNYKMDVLFHKCLKVNVRVCASASSCVDTNVPLTPLSHPSSP